MYNQTDSVSSERYTNGHVRSYFSTMARCFMMCRSKPVPTIDSLPDEILLVILEYLSVYDVMKCERVCRRWRRLSRDDTLWRRTQISLSSQLREVCPITLSIIRSHCNVVHNLKLQYILNYPLVSEITGLCRNLCSLEMLMCRVQEELKEDLKRWPKLKKLNLRHSMLLSRKAIMFQFDHFKDLNYLGLSDFGLTMENCDSLLKLQNLNHIDIEDIQGLTLEYIKRLITVKQKTLITLHLYGEEAVDDECLKMLAECPVLKDLAIIHCDYLTDRAFDSFSKFLHLTRLQLWNNSAFTEERLVRALKEPSMTKLQKLSLSRIVNVTRAIVEVILEYYKNLTFIALYKCPKIIIVEYENKLKSKFQNSQIVLY